MSLKLSVNLRQNSHETRLTTGYDLESVIEERQVSTSLESGHETRLTNGYDFESVIEERKVSTSLESSHETRLTNGYYKGTCLFQLLQLGLEFVFEDLFISESSHRVKTIACRQLAAIRLETFSQNFVSSVDS